MELDSSEPKGKILDRRFLLMLCDVVCGTMWQRKTENGKQKTDKLEGGTRATRDAHVVATHRTIPDADTPSSLPRYEMRYLLLSVSAPAVGGYG
eukprot:scaffold26695_cov71-Cyclotella_meneghiniana.AAC.11